MAVAAGHSSLVPVEHGPIGTTRSPFLDTLQRRHAFGRRRVPLRKRVTLQGVRVQSRAGARQGNVKAKEEEEIEVENLGSGTRKVKLPGTMKLRGPQSKDNQVVFVAGATGRVGSRTVRELLRLGFRVRASTRNVEKARALFEDVLQNVTIEQESKPSSPLALFSPAKLFGFLKPKRGKQLDIVDCDLESPETIELALGNAGVVVCCIGASEKEVLDVTGPYRIDFKATKNLIDAACEAQVNHFVLLTSLGTQKLGFPAAVLNLFWGVLVWKAKAEKALIASGLPYTIIRPGGMEKPTDAYKETHNLLLAEADKLFGGQVSSLQVAELIACAVENLQLSKNKILEVVAETTAPLRPIEELLKEIPSTVEEESFQFEKPPKSRPQRLDLGTQKLFKKQEEQKVAEEKRVQAQKAEDDKRKLEALKVKYEREIFAAKEKEEEARTAAESALAEKAELEKRAAEVRAKAEAAALAARQAKALEAAILAAARKGKVLSELEKEKILASVKPEAVKTSKESEAPAKKSRVKFPFFEKGKIQQEDKATPSAQVAEDKQSQKEKQKETKAKEVEGKLEAARIAEAKQKEEQEKANEKTRRAEQEAAAEAKKKEDQEKAEAEAKKKELQEKAEAEAQIAAQAKEMEEQQKAKAEAKKKEDQEKAEAEAQIAAEAKKKEEQEKAEAEAQRVEQEKVNEEKRRAQEEAAAEAKKKEEQERAEAEAQIAAEAKRKEEQEKAEAEAKKKEDQKKAEIEAQIAAEAKKKEEQGKAEAEAQWVAAEQEAAKVEESTEKEAEAEANLVGKKVEPPNQEQDPVTSQTNEESLKTTVSKSTVTEDDQAGETKEETAKEQQARRELIQKIIERERAALDKAKSATAFFWPWQKPETTTEKPIETPPAGDLDVGSPTPVFDDAVNKEDTQPIPASSRPLSLYETPPAVDSDVGSPTPVLDDAVNKEDTQPIPASSRPLSPYATFPGLKPPSSPTPSPPVAEMVDTPTAEDSVKKVNLEEPVKIDKLATSEKEEPVESDKLATSEKVVAEKVDDEGEDEARRLLALEVAEREREAVEKAKAATSFLWPWQKQQKEEKFVNSTAGSVIEKDLAKPQSSQSEAQKPESQPLPPCSRPLSPYTQFPGLKPPTSPLPSPPPPPPPRAGEIKVEAALSQESSTPLSPYSKYPSLKPPGSPAPPSDNGAMTEESEVCQQADEEKIPESASTNFGFWWPWQ